MTLDSINLYTAYGWRLSNVEGHLNQPARKKVLKDEYLYGDDRTFEAQKVTVTLFQKFATKPLMKTGVDNIYALILANPVHTVNITEHSLTAFSAVVRDGIHINYWGLGAEMKITFTKTTV